LSGFATISTAPFGRRNAKAPANLGGGGHDHLAQHEGAHVDFDKSQFLTDVFEALLTLPGDPVRQIDRAAEDVIAAQVTRLRALVQHHRADMLDMVEERRRTGQPVHRPWRRD
jgi:hypothetical protein